MQLPLFVCSFLFTALIASTPQAELPKSELEQLLNHIMMSRFPGLQPAQDSQPNLDSTERARLVHEKAIKELSSIITNFNSNIAQLSDFKSFIFRTVDKQLANTGASIQFSGVGPTLVIERQLAILYITADWRANFDWPNRALSLVSSFERTPQTGEDIFEVHTPLPTGPQQENALLVPLSPTLQPAMIRNQPVTLRKCRSDALHPDDNKTCLTSLYLVQPINNYPHLEVMACMLSNADGPEDAVMNKPQGLTTVWIAHQAGPSVLLYKFSAWSSDANVSSFDQRVLANRLNDQNYERLLRHLEEESKRDGGFRLDVW